MLVLNFKNYYEEIVKNMNLQIEKIKGKIYLFGGHIFSQYLIQFGLNIEKIIGILDNSKDKENDILYGTNLIVKNPSIIVDNENVYVIVKAATYQEEIENQLYELNPSVIIIK